MARKKISEFRAKKLLLQFLEHPYHGVSFDAHVDDFSKLDILDVAKTYVVKVDEGVKKRMKNGLVALNKTPQELPGEIKKLQEKGYTHFIIEPFILHASSSEKYISIERVREGLQVLYSEKGGIDVEENQESIKKVIITYSSAAPLVLDFGMHQTVRPFARTINLDENILSQLLTAFNKYHFSFLEINPLVIEDGKTYFLDVAGEVDSAGEFFVANAWTEKDLRSGDKKQKTEEEKNIAELVQKSQASFALTTLNPDGAVFMLLSGGGASIVLADEVYDLGFGKELANYGEYSGNPNAEEVAYYTSNILDALLRSKAPKKVLLIGGGVANFTDVRATFKGIIKSLNGKKEALQKQGVKIFVRRGGPHQEEGLAMMEKFLKENELFGLVADQKTTLPEIVRLAIEEIK